MQKLSYIEHKLSDSFYIINYQFFLWASLFFFKICLMIKWILIKEITILISALIYLSDKSYAFKL